LEVFAPTVSDSVEGSLKLQSFSSFEERLNLVNLALFIYLMYEEVKLLLEL
jgi:hypothetical protein